MKLQLRDTTQLTQLAFLTLVSTLSHLSGMCCALSRMCSITLACHREFGFLRSSAVGLLSAAELTFTSNGPVLGEVIDKLIEGEYAKRDFIISCPGATLKQAGESDNRRGTRVGR